MDGYRKWFAEFQSALLFTRDDAALCKLLYNAVRNFFNVIQMMTEL